MKCLIVFVLLSFVLFAVWSTPYAQTADKHPKGTALGRAGYANKSLAIQGFAQFRYEQDRSGSEEGTEAYFQLRRFRFRATADGMTHFRVRVQLALQEFANSAGTGDLLEEAYVRFDPDPSGVSSRFRLIMGQQKIPVMREELRSSSEQLVVDRGIVNSAFKKKGGWVSYDLGVLLDGSLSDLDIPLEYQVGVFNGEGRNASDDFVDPNTGKLFAARARLSPVKGLELGGSVALRNLVGDKAHATYTVGKGSADLPEEYSEAAMALGGDLGWAYSVNSNNRLTVEAEVLQGTNMEAFLKAAKTATGSSWAIAKPSDEGFTMRGFQISPHFFHRLSGKGLVKAVEVGARIAHFDPDIAAVDDGQTELALAVGLHIAILDGTPNQSRLQVEFTRIRYEESGKDPDAQFKVQWQVRY
ncbi:MAG: porin [Candidatus Latescibacterota bacterium]